MIDDDIKSQFPFLKHGIWQISVLVEDLDQAVENYWKLFGIGPWRIYTYARPFVKSMTYRGKPAEYKLRLAFSQIGSLQIELMEQVEGETIHAEFIKKRRRRLWP
jgi:hypothetical protein